MGRFEVIGSAVIVLGLALFAIYGDPAGGKENAPGDEWAIAIGVLAAVSAVLLVFGGRGGLTVRAAVYGTVAGILFGLSASLTKPTLDYLHESIGELLSHWEPYALAIAGILGFVLQQVSLGTGKLAPSVATVSVANPIVGILLGILLFDERLSRPAWHVVVACIGLGVALVGAVLIALARHEGEEPGAAGRVRRDRVAAYPGAGAGGGGASTAGPPFSSSATVRRRNASKPIATSAPRTSTPSQFRSAGTGPQSTSRRYRPPSTAQAPPG